jgi:hypothetical protein
MKTPYDNNLDRLKKIIYAAELVNGKLVMTSKGPSVIINNSKLKRMLVKIVWNRKNKNKKPIEGMTHHEKREYLKEIAALIGGIFINNFTGGYIEVKGRRLLYISKSDTWKFYQDEETEKDMVTVDSVDKLIYYFGLGYWKEVLMSWVYRANKRGLYENHQIMKLIRKEYPHLTNTQLKYFRKCCL